MSNNLPLCCWWKHTNFIKKIPLWWWFSPLKSLSPFNINGKGFLLLWLISVYMYATDQNMNSGNSPYNHSLPTSTKWIPLSICSLCLWLLSPFVSKREALRNKVSPPVISIRCHVYHYIQHTVVIADTASLLEHCTTVDHTYQTILGSIHCFSSTSNQMHPYLSMMLLYCIML
jgi:hypothetical protein